MPQLIAEIEKLIVAKEKMAEKNKTELPKVEKEYIALAEQKEDYDDKIKKERDKKKQGEMEKARDEVIKKYNSAKFKYSTMEKAEEGIQEALKELKAELEKAKKGVEDYGKARQAGIDMLDREGKKLQRFCDEALRGSQDAETCSAQAEQAAKTGDENGAQGARNNANNAVMITVEAAKKAKELIEEITSTMTSTQRNLKAKDFDVADKDIMVHNKLTKTVQDNFKVLEQMAGRCPNYVKNAEDAAAEAADFANATAVGIDLYKSIVEKATLAGVKKIEGIKLATASKWGGYISDKGELFTRLLNALTEKPQDLPTRTMAEKAVEQGQTFLDSTFNNVNDKIQELIDGVKKATKRVPVEYQRPLKQQIDKLNMMVIQMVNYKKKFQGDYDATHAEYQKLADAI